MDIKPEGNVDKTDEHKNLDEWTDYSSECLTRTDAKDRNGDCYCKLEIIAGCVTASVVV